MHMLLEPESLNILPGGQHSELESDASEFMERRGYFVDIKATYHERLPRRIARLLGFRYDPTSLYLRARADRIAVHQTLPIQFEWEAKTHRSIKYHDMTIEALPLIYHLRKAELGVKCLYIYRDKYFDPVRDIGFWVDQMPPIRMAMIPERWEGDIGDWYFELITRHLPGVRVQRGGHTAGTDDPFVIIDESYLLDLVDWRQLILGLE